MAYTTIITEGGLLPADILEAIATEDLSGQRPEDFGLERGRNLSDRIAAAWQAARGHWMLFKTYVDDLRESDPGTTVTRQRWVLPLLDVLGYQLAFNASAYTLEGRTYAISHRAGTHDDAPPVHIEGIRTSLDARPPSGRPRLSPHALLQEYLNSTEHLWGLVTNGERLRLLRDSSRFTRPAYVEFDLRAMFEGEKFSEFALLYRLIHRSRLPQDSTDASSCLLEKYHQQAVETGGRVREKLRDGVELALRTLGSSLLEHPANAALRAKLEQGQLTPLAYYRQLLKLIYRLLFLMVVEERGLIATGTRRLTATEDDPFEITSVQSFDALLSSLVRGPSVTDRLRIYYNHYSVARLRRLAEAPGTGRGPYDDLWMGLQTTFRLLEGSDEQSPRSLGLAPLDGDLFGPEAIADLEGQSLRNADLLRAIRALSLYREKERKALRRVNYGALDVEELGSVYESLLDYRPVIGAGSNSFDLVTGTERKTTGSYYTRPELVQELIKSALVPVIEDRLSNADKATRKPGDKVIQSPAEPASPSPREQALLAIKVCDPACGSGAFLLAAARRIGRELAKVRSGEDQPTPAIFRRAVRDVIQQCIYGVDLNPLAVDLCKLALWLEGHNAGMPLNFLDHHIKQGNSLIGGTRALVAQGIPDDAYKAVTGDDKKVSAEIRKRNKIERERYLHGYDQPTLFKAPTNDGGLSLAEELRQLDAMSASSVAEVRAKASRYKQVRADAEGELTHFNLWTSAFFQPLTTENLPGIPTTQTLADYERNPRIVRADILGAANGLAAEAGFFHWELEFPQVFDPDFDTAHHPSPVPRRRVASEGGFDIVLGNPPWERIKLEEQEHFVDVPAIRDATNKSTREKMIAEWRNGTPTQQARIAEFDTAKYRAEAESRFVRASGRFPLTAVGDVNTYALFAEHARDLLAPTGRAGIIVPTGIATDKSMKLFFGSLLLKKHLVEFVGFINSRKIFPEIKDYIKFALMTIGYSRQAEFMFGLTEVSQIRNEQRRFTLSETDFTLLNPNTGTCPVFRNRIDTELTKKVYLRVPILFNQKKNENPWGITFMTMFHMSNDSNLFHFQSGQEMIPIYEAKMMHLFDHRFSTYENATESNINEGNLPQLTPDMHADPYLFALPRYWILPREVEIRIASRSNRKWLIGFRDVTGNASERTAIFSLLPLVGIGNNAPLLFPNVDDVRLVSSLLATLNGLVFDYITRQKVPGAHMNFFIVEQLPILPPAAFSADDIAFIVPRVLELVYTAWDIKAFAEDVWGEADETMRTAIMRCNTECNADAPADLFAPRDSFILPPFRWSDERRALIRAELDARIAKLYGLTRDELRYILDPHDVYGPDFPGETFRVLKEKEIRLYGEYRTRRLVLAAWDAAGY